MSLKRSFVKIADHSDVIPKNITLGYAERYPILSKFLDRQRICEFTVSV